MNDNLCDRCGDHIPDNQRYCTRCKELGPTYWETISIKKTAEADV